MPFFAYSPTFKDSKLFKASGLYVVTAPFLESHQAYKFGKASALGPRMNAYRGYFTDLAPVKVIIFYKCDNITLNEGRLRRAFAKYRVRSIESDYDTEYLRKITEEQILEIFAETFPDGEFIINEKDILADHSLKIKHEKRYFDMTQQTHDDVKVDLAKEKFMVVSKEKNKFVIKSLVYGKVTSKLCPDVHKLYSYDAKDLKGTAGYENWKKQEERRLKGVEKRQQSKLK